LRVCCVLNESLFLSLVHILQHRAGL
jgi:hypothetical protein